MLAGRVSWDPAIVRVRILSRLVEGVDAGQFGEER